MRGLFPSLPLAAALLLGSATNEARAVTYTVTDLGTLGGPTSYAWAVDGGKVVGYSVTTAGELHGFLWTSSAGMVDLGTLGWNPGFSSQSDSVALGISGSTIVGGSYTNAGPSHAFVKIGSGPLLDIGTLGGGESIAWGVDGSNVVGYSTLLQGSQLVTHAFLWNGSGSLQDLGTLPGKTNSWARAVSGNTVVGTSWTGASDHEAFIYTSTNGMVPLGTLGGAESFAYGVSGTNVVGRAQTSSGESHAFFYPGSGPLQDMGTFGGNYSQALDIYGTTAVGSAKSASGIDRAFLWTPTGGMVDITPLGWAWAIATGIDSQGRIVGYGLNPQNKEHAFLLTPNVIVKGGPGGNGNQTERLEVPEPASSALALFGAAALLSARGRRRARASCG